MKRIFIVLVLAMLIVAAVPFVTLGPDGGPLLTPYHLTHPQAALDRLRLRFLAEEHTVYKWQDDSGRWVYGTEPPAGVEAEAIGLHSETNVVPAFEADEQ